MLVVAVMVFTGCLRGSPVDEGGVGPTVETAEVDVPMPTLPLPPSVPLALDLELKTFVLSWPAVDDAIGTTVRERLTRDGGFTDIARLDPAVTELSHPVPVFARLQAAYMVEVCNASGCTDSEPRTVPPDLAEAIGFVKAPLPGDNDLFGRSVALSADGSTLAVGAPEADGPAPGLFNNGAVFVYVRAESEGAWTLQHVLRADPAEGSDMFGQAMDISADGSVVVAGARFESTGPTSNSEARNSGAAYIFERDANGSWEQKAFLKAMNASPEDLFGWDVAVSGDGATVAVTATNEDSSVNGDDASMEQNVGAAYVFERIQSSHWEQTAFVKASNAESFDFFGTSVDLDHDGDRLLVGANRESGGGSGVNPDGDGNSADQSGAAYLFFRNSDWEERAYLKARSPQEGARFGDEVALSGSGTVAVVGGPAQGIVEVFELRGDLWDVAASLEPPSNVVGFGGTLSASHDGERLAVGWHGQAAVYERVGDEWFTLGELTPQRGMPSERDFGRSVAISADGSTLALGDPRDGEEAPTSGAVHLY